MGEEKFEGLILQKYGHKPSPRNLHIDGDENKLRKYNLSLI